MSSSIVSFKRCTPPSLCMSISHTARSPTTFNFNKICRKSVYPIQSQTLCLTTTRAATESNSVISHPPTVSRKYSCWWKSPLVCEPVELRRSSSRPQSTGRAYPRSSSGWPALHDTDEAADERLLGHELLAGRRHGWGAEVGTGGSGVLQPTVPSQTRTAGGGTGSGLTQLSRQTQSMTQTGAFYPQDLPSLYHHFSNFYHSPD